MANTGSSKDRAPSRLKNIFFTCMSKYLKFERIFHYLIAYWIQVEQIYGSHFQMKKLRLVTLKALPKFTRLKSDWAQVACRAVQCGMLPHTRLPSSCLLTRKDSQQCSSSPCDGRIPVHDGSTNMKYSLSRGLSVWELPATTGNTENENSKLKTMPMVLSMSLQKSSTHGERIICFLLCEEPEHQVADTALHFEINLNLNLGSTLILFMLKGNL